MIARSRWISGCVITSLTVSSAVQFSVAAQQSLHFKGRVVVQDGGPSPARLTVHLGQFGSTATNDAGFFTIALPAGTTSVTIQVETGDPKWVVRYPTGPVPVPADAAAVTDVVVALSVEASLARAYAVDNAQLQQRLTEAGVKQDQALDILERMRADFADRTQVEVEELRIAAQRESDRVRAFTPISVAIERYVTEANDLQNAFIFISDEAFRNAAAFTELKNAILEYNGACDTLNSHRAAFESTVGSYWKSEKISSDLRDLFDYALGEVHRVRILPLNNTLGPISDIRNGRAGKQSQEMVTAEIKTAVRDLAPRLEELGRRKDRVLLELQSGTR